VPLSAYPVRLPPIPVSVEIRPVEEAVAGLLHDPDLELFILVNTLADNHSHVIVPV
jgi:hypothetical protein